MFEAAFIKTINIKPEQISDLAVLARQMLGLIVEHRHVQVVLLKDVGFSKCQKQLLNAPKYPVFLHSPGLCTCQTNILARTEP